MKTPLLFISLLISVTLFSQEFCTYNSASNINFGNNSIDEPFETFELEDGKFIIVGTTYFNSSNSFRIAVCRMNADNTIDETFASNGRIQHTWDGRNNGISAELQSDGKILVGGYQAPGNGISGFRPYVGRLNANGSVDASFGEEGSARLEIQSAIKGSVIGIKQLEDGKILAAATTNGPAGFALIRLMPDGSYDPSFNGTGHILHQDTRVVWQSDYGDALFMNDGSMVVVTKSLSGGNTRAMICKLNADGSLNQTFGTNGVLEIETLIQLSSAGIHAALDNEENILIATTSQESPKKYQVAKVFSDTGVLDTDFGDDGMATSSNAASFNAVHGIAVNPTNGDIYVVGSGSNSSWNNSIWKLDLMGNEQEVCNGTTFYTFPIEGSNGLRTVDLYSDGNLKLVGEGSGEDLTNPDIPSQNRNWSVLQFTTPTGLNEMNGSELLLYPNPVMNILSIKSTNSPVQNIRIRNLMGQTVLSDFTPSNSIDVSGLARGIYLAEIKLSQGTAIRKFIKQ